MARASYGPETKKRSRRLLEALLVYANDELDCRDESVLETLRPQIQTRWQSENRLVVSTKVRFLQVLTTLEAGKTQLNAQQIKEALKWFTDFLQILEDNRPSRAGSETWHFTLKLWHKRQEVAANLQQFDMEWEHRRPEKSKQVASGDGGENITPSSHHLPNWQAHIPQVHKEEFIQALIEFSDRCGGYYHYQAYFLAAQGIAEFTPLSIFFSSGYHLICIRLTQNYTR